jgi:HAD superfamily hydrolase (TIGR01549 family)
VSRYVAVTFDFWNTLMVQDPVAARAHRRAAWRLELFARGHDVPDEVLDTVFVHAAERFDESWRAGVQYTFEHAIDDASRLLGADLSPDDVEALRRAWREASATASVRLTDGAAHVVTALHEAGVRTAVICDVGMAPSSTLRTYLHRVDLNGRFGHFSFSDEVGVYKPDRRIFEHALAGLGVDDPARALHVGDIRRTDVAGARSMGMTSVRYRGASDDPDPLEPNGEADHVIDDLRDLLGLL